MNLAYLLILLTVFITLTSEPSPKEENNKLNHFSFERQWERSLNFYFPSTKKKEDWQTLEAASLGLQPKAFQDLEEFLNDQRTGGFLILYRGKILYEKYFRARRKGTLFRKSWGRSTSDPVFSVGKSIHSMIQGLAHQQGKLDWNNSVSSYLGPGWTRSEAASHWESQVTLLDLMAMDAGLNKDLQFQFEPHTNWLYSPAYAKIIDALEMAYSKEREAIYRDLLFEKLGLENTRFEGKFLSMTTRDMGRFGLMVLSGGRFGKISLIKNFTLFDRLLKSSQPRNPAYGLLWWLNGKSHYVSPGKHPKRFEGSLITTAPKNMVSALGFGHKRIYILPDQDLVVVRHGVPARMTFGGDAMIQFDRDLWKILGRLIPKLSDS